MSVIQPRSSGTDLTVTVDRDVVVLTLNRPTKLNALTRAMRRDLAELLGQHGGAPMGRGVVVTGSGRAFSAGMDLAEAAGGRQPDLVAEMDLFNAVTRAALTADVPVVAAVNGPAIGGAGEMALSFDARIGITRTSFSWPENSVGLTVSNAASLFLPRLVGRSRALRLVLDSAHLDADRCLEAGLLDEVVEEDDLVPAAVRLALRWTRPGAATAAHLRLLRPEPGAVASAMAREIAEVRRAEAEGSAQAAVEAALASSRR